MCAIRMYVRNTYVCAHYLHGSGRGVGRGTGVHSAGSGHGDGLRHDRLRDNLPTSACMSERVDDLACSRACSHVSGKMSFALRYTSSVFMRMRVDMHQKTAPYFMWIYAHQGAFREGDATRACTHALVKMCSGLMMMMMMMRSHVYTLLMRIWTSRLGS